MRERGPIRLVRGLPPGASVVDGDCLDVLSAMARESVDLVYLDPPFNSGRKHVDTYGEFHDSWGGKGDGTSDHPRVALAAEAALEFHGRAMKRYILEMGECVAQLDRVLTSRGSLYLHCDDSAEHYLKMMLDGVLGKDSYRSSITWRRTGAHNATKHRFSRVCDRILHYARPGAPFKPQYTPNTPEHMKRVYCHDDGDGKGLYGKMNISCASLSRAGCFDWRGYGHPPRGWCYSRATMQSLHDQNLLCYPVNEDGTPAYDKRVTRKKYIHEVKGRMVGNLWDDITNLHAVTGERVGYPTQKPLALLERVIMSSSSRGDLVLDPFMGSGTTLVAAVRAGRRAMGCDRNPAALKAAVERLTAETGETEESEG